MENRVHACLKTKYSNHFFVNRFSAGVLLESKRKRQSHILQLMSRKSLDLIVFIMTIAVFFFNWVLYICSFCQWIKKFNCWVATFFFFFYVILLTGRHSESTDLRHLERGIEILNTPLLWVQKTSTRDERTSLQSYWLTAARLRPCGSRASLIWLTG